MVVSFLTIFFSTASGSKLGPTAQHPLRKTKENNKREKGRRARNDDIDDDKVVQHKEDGRRCWPHLHVEDERAWGLRREKNKENKHSDFSVIALHEL